MKRIIKFHVLLLVIVLSGSFSYASPVAIELWNYKQEIVEQWKRVAEAFHKKNPDIKLDVTTVVNETAAVLRSRLIGGDAPDLIQLQSYSLVFDYAKAGYLLDLTDEAFMGRIADGTKNSVTYKGRMWALPMDVAGIGIIYNKDIFSKYGLKIPTDFTELKAVCDKLTKNGTVPFSACIRDNWPSGHLYTMGHTALVGSDLNNWLETMSEGKGTVQNSRMKELYSWLDYYKTQAGPKAEETNYNDQTKNFASGNYAMMIQGLWAYGSSKAINPELNAGFFPVPFTNNSHETKLYVDTDSTIAISSDVAPEKQIAAKKFLEFMTSPEGVSAWVNDFKLVSTVKDADASSMDAPYQDLVKYLNEGKTMPWAFSMWPNPVFEDAAKVGTQEYLLGRKSADEHMKMIDQQWKATVK